jgi:hypothetical protein
VNCGKLSDKCNKFPQRENPSCLIVFDKRKEYPSWAGKIYPSTIEEECSTFGNVGREGITGILG